jgi:hypothetical protein
VGAEDSMSPARRLTDSDVASTRSLRRTFVLPTAPVLDVQAYLAVGGGRCGRSAYGREVATLRGGMASGSNPTVVNNAETLAVVAHIMAIGVAAMTATCQGRGWRR